MSDQGKRCDQRSKIIHEAEALWRRGMQDRAIAMLVNGRIAQTPAVARMMLGSWQEAQQDRRPAPATTLLGLLIPKGWQWAQHFGPAGEIWVRAAGGLQVIETLGEHDEQEWHHCSCSYGNRHIMPSYADLAEMKRLFVGSDRTAIQVFPRQTQHVNIHEYTLHLWVNLSNPDWIPDFAPEGTI